MRSTELMMEINDLDALVCKAKLRLLQMHYESGVGHIGGNLSSLHLLIALYHSVLKSEDLFVLSKGHSAGALYVTLWTAGRMRDEDLKTFHKDATRLPGHPPAAGIAEIVFATGSLGHGLGLAAGLALGKKLKQQTGRVFCLTSDGEWDEGSCWEALIFLAHRQLCNLTVLVDSNGLQGFGRTSEVANLEPMAAKLASFGVDVIEIDGHDIGAIIGVLRGDYPAPRVVIAKTVKGHGVSFMENRVEWHYLPLDEHQYNQACAEVQKQCETCSVDR